MTGGKDSVILVWKSNLNSYQVETLGGYDKRLTTEVFLTDKKEVSKLPQTTTTTTRGQENKQPLINK